MITWGISANSHDAAIAVFRDKELVYAGHSERYSKVKNDGHLHSSQVTQLINKYGIPDKVVWYEKPIAKSFRQWWAGQGLRFSENNIRQYLSNYGITAPIEYVWHHHSHAAAGYYTSEFKDACVVVIDAIGEFETLTIWEGKHSKLTKKFKINYPDSVGLWYSALTQRCGLKPNEEEYILMGMAALGSPYKHYYTVSEFIDHYVEPIQFTTNLHKGCLDWHPELTSEQDFFDLAAATQARYERIFLDVLTYAHSIVPSDNLVLMGGCALNCVANRLAINPLYSKFKNVWIMPNPGDAGSSVGAVLAKWQHHIKWPGPFLGFDMGYTNSNDEIIDYILEHGIAAVARGRAEFGPRALGNRSLLADPRLPNVKDRLNAVKRREPFRPFAPAILAEHAAENFKMPCEYTPYMQFAVKCLHPDRYPAIVHIDNTSRVQTITKNDNQQFRDLLERWYARTGCPMLVNTSLNIKGEPMINDHADADRWEQQYNIRVFR